MLQGKKGLMNTKSIAKAFQKKKKGIAMAVAVMVFFGIVAGLYALSPEPGSAEENIAVKVVDTLADELNPFRTAEPLNEFVKEYDFELSSNDLNYFNEAGKESTEAGYITMFASHWRNVKLSYEGVDHDVEMSLHGDLPNHYNMPKKSFKIKADKNDLIDNTRRYNFVIAEDKLFFGAMYAEWLAKRLGLVTSHYELGLVRINGFPQGLYLVEEDWDAELMEKNRQPGTIVINYSDNWVEDNVGYESHITPFDLEISNFREIDPTFGSQVNGRLHGMLEAVRDDNQELFDVYFDGEQVARLEAWRAILGQEHDFDGDNLRLFYDTTSGKFGLVPRNEGGVDKLVSCTKAGSGILSYVSENQRVLERKAEILRDVLRDKEELVAFYEELEKKYLGVSLLDNTSVRRSSKVAYYDRRNKRYLMQNIDLLSQCL